MQSIEQEIKGSVLEIIRSEWKGKVEEGMIQIQKTRREFKGDFTLVVFPLLRVSGMGPEQTGDFLGKRLSGSSDFISGYNVIKGFLNLTISESYWKGLLGGEMLDPEYGYMIRKEDGTCVVIEFSSPNTNKPLHLGHIRNNLLGNSVSRILEAAGHSVKRVNLVNDRGIHICKSMLAWQKYGNGETPATSGLKGDHLVGKYYVEFDRAFKEEVKNLVANGMDIKTASIEAPILQEAREMLRKWEAGDPDVRELWQKMNGWVYEGFEETYRRLGIRFDKTYYESETYSLGKEIILKGLKEGVLYRKDDGSVWADLEKEGLDHKLLLRSDGTSVYMTQDVGTAHQRYDEFGFDRHIYVVGNEQNYHFQVLAIVLKKLGFSWADRLYHLSYGMVELPEGRMKSREGTVVDADDLMDEMEETARQMSDELGKLEGFNEEERKEVCRKVGMGAVKYFILKVDPRKNMTFDPKESVDFNGNTGPFIQYTFARINSVLRRAEGMEMKTCDAAFLDKEVSLVRMVYDFPVVIAEAAGSYNPSLLANFLYELAKEFNQFYHDHSILNAGDPALISQRLLLVRVVGQIIGSGMDLLGIELPERM